MARKNLLQGLIEGAPVARAEEAPALPRYDRGAIGAVSKSIGDLKRRAIIDVPADMIDAAGFKDRLDEDPAGLAALTESIRDYGQQVPVLLRHNPNQEGRYEVVYGRRRVAALKALRQPVKAMVRAQYLLEAARALPETEEISGTNRLKARNPWNLYFAANS